jgi:heptosyltransferase-3
VKRIFVWHPGALGDVLLSARAISAIKRGRSAHLHLAARDSLSEILLRSGVADEVSLHDSAFFSGLFADDPPTDVKKFLKGFSAAFVFTNREDSLLMRNMRTHVPLCSVIRTVPPPGPRVDVSAFQMEQVKAFGIRAAGIHHLEWTTAPLSGNARRRTVALHPGSGGKKKCWPLKNYLDLADELGRRHDLDIDIIIGPAEGPAMRNSVADAVTGRRLPIGIVSGEALSDIASLLKCSLVYIGNDSGITHLAALLGVPVVALFGPTDHLVWGPVGDSVRIVRSAHPCSPCREEIYRACQDARCLKAISVAAVVEEIELLRRCCAASAH